MLLSSEVGCCSWLLTHQHIFLSECPVGSVVNATGDSSQPYTLVHSSSHPDSCTQVAF